MVDLSYFDGLDGRVDVNRLALQITKDENNSKNSARYRAACQSVSHIHTKYFNTSSDIIEIGKEEELTANDKELLLKALKAFIPWRKGPFTIFSEHIDSEWKSELKYNRIESELGELSNKVICDVGCNNGYYMYRLLHHKPKLVWGFDPVEKYHYNIELLQSLIEPTLRPNNLKFSQCGFQALENFENTFDVILCMGILYHHPNPIEILKLCHHALKKKGLLIIESLAIAGEEPYCLFPDSRYAQMRNVFFIPTRPVLESWLKRSQFRERHCFYNEPMPEDEQRTTKYSPFDSFSQFLDKKDPTLTKEGYIRPNRIYFSARK